LASSSLEKTLAGFLEQVASRTAAPGGGAVAAVLVALGAALVEMVARFSAAEPEIKAAATLRSRVSALAQADADAYSAYLAEPSDATHSRTVAVPLEIAAIGAEVATLAADLAERGNPNLRGDAVTAALAASAGASACAALVEINVRGRADERGTRARDHARAAGTAAERAQETAVGL
jgi:formiminotetrahydrofolate cyclodeaminase